MGAGPRRRSSTALRRVAERDSSGREGARLHPVRRHRGLPGASSCSRAAISGDGGRYRRSANPTALAWRFSPVSNEKRSSVAPDDELRVLIATDVLSEGQNLQDCAHRRQLRPALGDHPAHPARRPRRPHRAAGRDHPAATRSCPPTASSGSSGCAARVRQRLRENAEVVGTDERSSRTTTKTTRSCDLYNEKCRLLDGEADGEVDLASHAYQIWQNAIEAIRGFRRRSRSLRRSRTPRVR